ncbi:Kinetochore protein Sos7 [Neolecta irregularis DAH-3]|uniref:Kinetochore protein Sos7 n=1 Tax=Neolecta irregularis (strain DAH-3) TaxID=1198029 RepID=A0A1U7LJ90_NEOID|nr:Kinetochore protein Sos7 [Neolecta irregularis DAH-3]|eukprot:OLL22663.1 Kinetochore protein Sos7 [Neolecta irregularis DAH-3]
MDERQAFVLDIVRKTASSDILCGPSVIGDVDVRFIFHSRQQTSSDMAKQFDVKQANTIRRTLDSFASTRLSLHRYREEFGRKTAQTHTGSTAVSDATRTSETTTIQSDLPNPLGVEADLNHFKELFSKLKFSYLEQETKEKYLKALLEDPPQFVDQTGINEHGVHAIRITQGLW